MVRYGYRLTHPTGDTGPNNFLKAKSTLGLIRHIEFLWMTAHSFLNMKRLKFDFTLPPAAVNQPKIITERNDLITREKQLFAFRWGCRCGSRTLLC